MTVLTRAQKERGMSLASQEGELRWAWGDWALDVAGPPPAPKTKDGSEAKIKAAFAELEADHSGPRMMLPSFSSIRQWRTGAHAIPVELRQMVRSPWIGLTLWRHVPDDVEREALVRKLAKAHPDNHLTERQVRDALGLKGKDGREGESEDERNVLMAVAEATGASLWEIREKRFRRDLQAAQRSAKAALESGADFEEAVEAAKVAYEQARLKMRVPDDEEQAVVSLQDAINQLAKGDLAREIDSLADALADALDPERVSEYLAQKGTQEFEYKDGSYTCGELLLDVISFRSAEIADKFGKALGLDPVRI